VPSKGSLRPINVNKEMHRLIDSLKLYPILSTEKEVLRKMLIDHLESLTFIHNSCDTIFIKYNQTHIISKITSILGWNITTILKILGGIKNDLYTNEDLNNLAVFLYESTWKLIIIFEEILFIKFNYNKKKKRELSYPHSIIKDSDNIDEKQLIKIIKEFGN